MPYLYHIIKSLHIIGIVVWMAGLFYWGRMFVYHAIALTQESPKKYILSDQYIKMSQRVYKAIVLPGFIISFLTGTYMFVIAGLYHQPWFHTKLLFVILLIIYHHYALIKIHKPLQNRINRFSVFYLRLFNEIASVLLIGIVFIVVIKDVRVTPYILGVMGIVSFFLYFFIRKKKFTTN